MWGPFITSWPVFYSTSFTVAVISREGQEENGEAVIVVDVWQRVYICYNTHVIQRLVPVCDNNSGLVRIILSVMSTSSSEGVKQASSHLGRWHHPVFDMVYYNSFFVNNPAGGSIISLTYRKYEQSVVHVLRLTVILRCHCLLWSQIWLI